MGLPPARLFFSIRDAEKLIPTLTRLLEYIRSEVTLYQRWGRAKHYTDENLRETINEIESHGCILRDQKTGIIDFPAIRLGEPVYLCWKFGERKIRYWHRIEEGCRERKPINPREFYDEQEIRSYTTKDKEILYEEEIQDHKVIVTIDLRGIDKNDLSVEIEENRLKISWREGMWRRTKVIILKNKVSQDVIENKYRNGILIVTLKRL